MITIALVKLSVPRALQMMPKLALLAKILTTLGIDMLSQRNLFVKEKFQKGCVYLKCCVLYVVCCVLYIICCVLCVLCCVLCIQEPCYY